MADTPNIRFSGFTDAWEQRKLGELVERYENPIETPHDGYERLGIRSHAKGTFHSYVEPGKELETAKMHRVAANNFIVNITFGWEHAVAITDESDAGKLVSHRFPQFSFTPALIPQFFKYVMVDKKFKEHLELSSPGGAGRNRVLKINEMLEYNVKYPSINEQTKIMKYFSNLDNLITFHQRKYLFAVDYFKAWEQRKLGDIANKITRKNQDMVVDEVLTNSAEYGIISQRDFFDKNIANGEKIDSYYIVEPDDFVYNPRISTLAPYGPINKNKLGRSGAMSPLYYVFRTHDIDTDYLDWFFQTSCWYSYMQFNGNSGARSDRFAITDKVFKEIPISVPQDIEEQKQIGLYLASINDLITFHRRAHK